MTRDEEIRLVWLAQAGDGDAMAKLIAQWRWMVLKLAVRFHETCPSLGVDDLMQEGWIKFCHAVRLFRADEGCRLSTPAITAVRRAMSNAVRQRGARGRMRIWNESDLDHGCRLDVEDRSGPEDDESGRPPVSLADCLSHVSGRQRKVLTMIAAGVSMRQGAKTLGVSRAMFGKIRDEAIAQIRRGLGIARGREAIGRKIVLGEREVVMIREMRAKGMRYEDIARNVGCPARVAQDAAVGKTWKHVSGPIASRAHERIAVDIVRMVRALRADGTSYLRIAEKVGCAPETARSIALGRTWKHVV